MIFFMASPIRSMGSLVLLYRVIGNSRVNLNDLAMAGEDREEGKLSKFFDSPKGPHLLFRNGGPLHPRAAPKPANR